MSKGWVSVHRSLQEKGWYKKSDYVHLWLHILLKANHKDAEFWFNGQNVKVMRGQFITGRKQLASDTGINESKVQRILNAFENEHQIEQLKTNRNRLITIVNYDSYQVSEQQTEQQVNNKRTTSEQQVNTNNNDNNENKFSLQDFENEQVWKESLLLKHKLSPKSLNTALDDFITLEYFEPTTKSLPDIKRHFGYWLSKRVEDYIDDEPKQNFRPAW